MTDARPFVDLVAQRRRLGKRIDAAIARVLAHGQFVMGPEVARLEAELAALTGARHVISCASGTDALLLILMAYGVGKGDAVFMPAFTFVASAEAAVLLGATPVFVDVDRQSFNLDPASLASALAAVGRAGELRPRVVIAVDLFGQPADYRALAPMVHRHGLLLVQDAAQSLGARWCGEPAGRQGDAAALSFYPSKPLGAYGDGGAVLTDDDGLATEIRMRRNHGEPPHAGRYVHLRVGLNSRLDTLQAAILLAKLAVFETDLARRAALAERYGEALGSIVAVPHVLPDASSAWAQYTIQVSGRDGLAAALRAAGIPTAVHYPTPLHRQPAYCACRIAPGGLPVAEALAEVVLSLPIHADLTDQEQTRVIEAVQRLVA